MWKRSGTWFSEYFSLYLAFAESFPRHFRHRRSNPLTQNSILLWLSPFVARIPS